MGRSTKSYKGFTLIEMLIVMGILILLMALGIGGGRLALQNAADVATQSAVKQLYEAAQTYYSKKGAYPAANRYLKDLMTDQTAGLKDYLESFDGGNDAKFWYFVDGNKQYVLVCASQGGTSSADARAVVCEGNGFGTLLAGTTTITKKKIDKSVSGDVAEFNAIFGVNVNSATVSVGTWSSKAMAN